MLPGPDLLFECPDCKHIVAKQSLMSGNTFGAVLYSDGRQVAPMLPNFPKITSCKVCKCIFWLDRENQIRDEDDLDPDNFSPNEIEYVRFLSVEEFDQAIRDKNVCRDKSDEKDLRLNLWWRFNDRYREEQFNLDNYELEHALFVKNHLALLNLLSLDDINEKIMIAEIHRNLGEFDKCLALINDLDDPNVSFIKPLFEEECKQRNATVFKLTPAK